MKIKWYIGGLIILLTGLIWFWQCDRADTQKSFRTQDVKRGSIANTISCTGTLEAKGTVEVGTQVSAILDHIYVDFNDQVKKGQILAVLDTVLLKVQVIEAEANYQKVEAQLEEARADFDRNQPLYQKGYISDAEFLPYKIKLKTQQAALKSAKASVIRAQRNLKYAVIHSPIDGTVIERDVEEGQTVAASLQAPTLFVIAEDLSKMEIHAQVDESDIGQIKEGQRVEFEVQAYPDQVFPGTVRQVRLQPEVVSNVVNYTVVVDAENDKNFLLPGMTATVDFFVEETNDVLLLPKAAVRFSPSEEMMEQMHEKRMQNRPQMPDSLRRPPMAPPESGQMPGQGKPPEDMQLVWYLKADGSTDAEPVKTGVTDGKYIEIVHSRNIQEGTRVITGRNGEQQKSAKSSSQNQSKRPMGPPPMF
jgi:HlyD family secretion protein